MRDFLLREIVIRQAFLSSAGAVGLTLGLVVIEDERLEEDTRDLVLFYVAGVAALTLVINGTLAGPLVRYLGLDRCLQYELQFVSSP